MNEFVEDLSQLILWDADSLVSNTHSDGWNHALVLSSALRSRLVVIKVAHIDPGKVTEEAFTTAARKQLDDRGISPEASPTLGKRRTLRIKDAEIVGYECR